MFHVNLPAGSTVRLHATARPGIARHRWDMRVLEGANLDAVATARLIYGSEIGAGDCEQTVEVPAQDVDCQLEVRSRHASNDGWKDDRYTVDDDTPDRLDIGFSDRALAHARRDDVLLSFSFQRPPADPARLPGRDDAQSDVLLAPA